MSLAGVAFCVTVPLIACGGSSAGADDTGTRTRLSVLFADAGADATLLDATLTSEDDQRLLGTAVCEEGVCDIEFAKLVHDPGLHVLELSERGRLLGANVVRVFMAPLGSGAIASTSAVAAFSTGWFVLRQVGAMSGRGMSDLLDDLIGEQQSPLPTYERVADAFRKYQSEGLDDDEAYRRVDAAIKSGNLPALVPPPPSDSAAPSAAGVVSNSLFKGFGGIFTNYGFGLIANALGINPEATGFAEVNAQLAEIESALNQALANQKTIESDLTRDPE
jgi:hypothetical protein